MRADEWVQITIGYLLCFFGILIIIAALKVRFWRIPWMESEGLGLAFIQNAMSKNRFDQIRRYIRFVNNRRLVSKGNRNWSPLQKINPFIEKMLERFRACYTMGQFMSIDGSMIKYKGKQIRFIQYMPAKPIKHGIKVFVLSCAETGYCYGFLIYCGKENDTSTPIEIVAKLFEQESDFIGSSAGRVVYMDNYYTSLTMIDYMYKQYKAFVVGTIALTKKKSRDSNDFPFHKLSGPATKKVGKGWLRIAQKKVFDSSGKVLKYIVQATTWMDRKQVAVLHNIYAGPAEGARTMRYNRKTQRREAVDTHPIIPNYIRYMRGVDMFDQSMNDYNISLRGQRWYLRIFYYICNAALANMRVITRHVVEKEQEKRRKARQDDDFGEEVGRGQKDPWAKYLGTMGWFQWMMDLGHSLIEAAILMEWTDMNDNSTRPKWMRQAPLKPCTCGGKCVFCKQGLTGKNGPPKKPRRRPVTPRPRTPSSARTPARSCSTPARSRLSSSAVPVHTKPGEKRVNFEIGGKNCGVCMKFRRKPTPKDTRRTQDNAHLYISKVRAGCPHPLCHMHPVCKSCWPLFNTNNHQGWSNFRP